MPVYQVFLRFCHQVLLNLWSTFDFHCRKLSLISSFQKSIGIKIEKFTLNNKDSSTLLISARFVFVVKHKQIFKPVKSRDLEFFANIHKNLQHSRTPAGTQLFKFGTKASPDHPLAPARGWDPFPSPIHLSFTIQFYLCWTGQI